MVQVGDVIQSKKTASYRLSKDSWVEEENTLLSKKPTPGRTQAFAL